MNKRLYPNRQGLYHTFYPWLLVSSLFLVMVMTQTRIGGYIGWAGFAGAWLAALAVAVKKRKELCSYYCSAKGFERVDLFGKRMKLIQWDEVAQIAALKHAGYLYVSEVERSWDQIRLYYTGMPEEDTMILPLDGEVVAEAMRRIPEEKWAGLQKMPRYQ